IRTIRRLSSPVSSLWRLVDRACLEPYFAPWCLRQKRTGAAGFCWPSNTCSKITLSFIGDRRHSRRKTAATLSLAALVQLGNAGTLAIGSLGIFVALRNQHRQLNAQMFIEFSARFQELLRVFPTEAWLANRNPSQPMPASSPEITECTLYAMQFIADI